MSEGEEVAYVCRDCGHLDTQWFMRCKRCDALDSACKPGKDGHINSTAMAMSKQASFPNDPGRPLSGPHKPHIDTPARHSGTSQSVPMPRPAGEVRSLADYRPDLTPRISTGSGELDRVLGGGFVPGEVVLLGGDPGVGKSSLLAQLQARIVAASDLGSALYASGEESYDQIGRRCDRIGVRSPRVHVIATSDIDEAISAAASTPRAIAVFDSVQVFRCSDARGEAGAISQVQACCARIVAYARATGVPCVIVCHITKDGELAGPKKLEHLVDCVVQVELAADGVRRLVSAPKNRHGSTDEIGVLEMTARGLIDAPRDERAALDRAVGRPGSAVACVSTGVRTSLVEVQALCAPPRGESAGKLTCVGFDPKRAATLLAVLSEHVGIDALASDVFVSVTGGVVLRDPAADAALAVAIASSVCKAPLDASTIVIGEVGLAGELRAVPNARARLVEAARAGLTRAIVAPGTAIPDDLGADILVLHAAGIEDAIALALAPAQGANERPESGADNGRAEKTAHAYPQDHTGAPIAS